MRQLKDLGFRLISPTLRWLAKQLLQRHQPQIVAITGSVGKTSTKRAVAAIVENDYRTQWHDGNYNSEVGLPLALFELHTPDHILNPFAWAQLIAIMLWRLLFWQYPYELLVLELGIDHPGDMDKFGRYIQADIGIITAVQAAHISGLGDIETVYQQKTKLMDFSTHTIVNGDDLMLHNRLEDDNRVQCYGLEPHNTIHPTQLELNKNGTIKFSVEGQTINSQLVGAHSALALLAAWLVGGFLEVDPALRARKLEELTPFPGRMNPLPGKNGSRLIDDSYNAVTPQAVTAALDTLCALPSQRKIAVLGTMNEQGELTEKLHRQVGSYVAGLELDMLLTVGDTAEQYIAAEAIDNDMQADSVHSFTSPYNAGNFLAPLLKKHDLVLIKGSQNGVYAEEVTALLLKNDADRSQLVRQEAFYLRLKHSQFDE